MRAKILLCMLFMFSFFLISSVSASYYDYTVELGDYHITTDSITRSQFTPHSQNYTLCASDIKIIPIWIKTKSSNSFDFDIKDASWATLSGNSFNLLQNQSGVVFLIVNPSKEGNYTLLFSIKTKGKYTGYVPINLNVEACYSVNLNISKDSDEICGCEETNYAIEIENKGEFKENIDLILEGADFVKLSNESLEVDSGDKSTLILTALPDCNESGSYNVKIIASLESNPKIKSESEIKLDVTPKEECYKSAITAPSSIRANYYGKTFPIKIRNNGAKKATYKVELSGLNWVKADRNVLTLDKGQETNLNINIKAPDKVPEGIYPFEIKLKTDDLEYSDEVNIVLREESKLLKSIRFGLLYYRYDIIAGVFVLIILTLLVFLIIKTLKKLTKKVKLILKKIFKIFLVALLILISLGLITSFFVYYMADPLKYNSFLSLTNLIDPQQYIFYCLIGAVIISIAIALIILIKKFIKKRKKSKKLKKEAVISEKVLTTKKIFSYFYIIICALIVLAGLVFLFTNFKLLNKLVFLFRYAIYYFVRYLYYIIIGIAVLAILYLIKRSKKGKKIFTKKIALKKIKKKWLKPFLVILPIIIVFGLIIYVVIHYNWLNLVKNFLVLYLPYVIAGVIILVLLIFFLKYKKEIIKLFKED